MTATNPMSDVADSSAQLQDDLDTAAAPGRNPARQRMSWLLTIFVLICVGYFLLPLFWLVVASTKSNPHLFSSFGLWFANYVFPGKAVLFAITLGAIMVPIAALTVPTYLLFARAGLTDTYLAIILPSLATPFGVFLMRVYAADAVDNALIEAARVDG